MKPFEKMLLQQGEILIGYVEQHSDQLSGEMKEQISSLRNRLDSVLQAQKDNPLFDMPLDTFLDKYCHYNERTQRIKNVFAKEGYKTLRDLLKVPRSELEKIKNFGIHSSNVISDALERANLDPFLVI